MSELSVVGKNVIRLDALEKVTGTALYAADEALGEPGMLHGKVLWSPHAHARIISIDISRAKKVPGVEAVLTGKDVPEARVGSCVDDQHMLAREKVRFVGDAVAVVAARTLEAAEEALALIKVKYEVLPAVFDAEEAMRPDCPVVLHPGLSGYKRNMYPYLGNDLPGPNVHTHHKVRRGNVEEGFRQADLIVENRFSTARISHCQLEPASSVARPNVDGTLVISTSTKSVYTGVQAEVCRFFGLPPSKVRGVTHYIGGNFGSAPRAHIFAALAAIRTGRPVKVVFSREECFFRDLNRLPMVIYLKDGVKKDGTLVARQIKLICNCGAYAQITPLVIRNGSFGSSQYRIPNFRWDAYGVYTNEPPSGAFRGFGNAQPFWAMEQHMDIIAEKLRMDPVELRQKNLIAEGEENLRGEKTHSMGAAECLDKVAQWIGWGRPTSQPSSNTVKVAKGFALANKYTQVDTIASALVRFNKDGFVDVFHGSDEIGQGSQTVLAQIAAEELGVPVEKIKVIWGDSARVPYDHGAISSRTTMFVGNAIRAACQDVKRLICATASPVMGAAPEDLEARGGQIYFRSNPSKSMPVSDLFLPGRATCLPHDAELLGQGTFFYKGYSDGDPETGQGTRLTASYCYTAHAVEVAVDTETGEVKVLRFCSATDVGRAINPKLCEAQSEGGIAQGIGSALYEEMLLDRGRVLNCNFHDYGMPRMTELPGNHDLKCFLVEANHREGPFGAKGMGEGAMTPSAPAIANAIYNATGVRLMDLPMSPERLLRALKAQNKEAGHKSGPL
ncbi:MAG: xanthine dehydrogenase family protein molybdopterin-binding subunit [Chloroflexi bacterium]|nr:xanthine dehydrogenase family protein molybdopterin-binding subunit [Chloroflexota bacterium]